MSFTVFNTREANEDIPESDEFHIKNILRNKLEVYDVLMGWV